MTPKERAAKAIDEAGEKWLEQNPCGDIDINDWATIPRNILVDAVLAAIAEPSGAMIDEMCMIYDGDYLTMDEAFAIWRAGHAAMMAETDKTK